MDGLGGQQDGLLIGPGSQVPARARPGSNRSRRSAVAHRSWRESLRAWREPRHL